MEALVNNERNEIFFFCLFRLWRPEAVCFLWLKPFTGDVVHRGDGFTLSQSKDIPAESSQKHPGGLPLTSAWEGHRFGAQLGLMGSSRIKT